MGVAVPLACCFAMLPVAGESRAAILPGPGSDPGDRTADTGRVLSLHGSTRPFPVRIVGTAGRTGIRADGEVADITRRQRIDADLSISGPSLATRFEVLPVTA